MNDIQALEQAIKLKVNDPEATKFITTVLLSLEREKPSLGVTADQAPVVCENFAFSVFNRADEEDRNGMASKTTAKIFYSAATFFDILEQFGELDNEVMTLNDQVIA
jgi:vacuolar protein sorting-associated protein VTA1